MKKYCDGVLKFLNIPYKLKRINQSEITGYGPKIYRMDFTGDVLDGIEELSLILECQTYLPQEDDIKRFFQYITLIRTFKNQNVELYILLTEKAPYDSLNFKINEDCIYKMNVISLKDIKATDIFNFIVQEFSGFFKPGINCTFSGLVPIFFLCGWSDAITFQMLSDKCHIICRFIICNIERWGKTSIG